VRIMFLGNLMPIISILLFPMNTQAAIQTRAVEYKCNDVVCEGYLAYNDALKDKVPGY